MDRNTKSLFSTFSDLKKYVHGIIESRIPIEVSGFFVVLGDERKGE